MKYGDLPTTTKLGVFLYCEECDAKYSAKRGDYFQSNEHDDIRCGEQVDGMDGPDLCGYLLILATEQRTITPL